MPAENSLKVNLEQKESLEFQHQPILSSDRANWDKIYFQYNHKLPLEFPEISFEKHCIHIYTEVPTGYIAEHRIDGHFQQSLVKAGHLLIVPSSLPYWFYDRKDHYGITLKFDPAFIARSAFEFINPDHVELIPHFPNKSDPLIYQIGLALKAELETDPAGSRLYAESAANLLAVHLLRHYTTRKNLLAESTGGLSKSKLQQVIDYIQDHLAEDISLEAIASELNMSQFYFARLFKQAVGIAPYQYVVQQRVNRAKVLLKQPSVTIADVALQCGFSNQSHFTTIFRQYTGITPSKYRNGL